MMQNLTAIAASEIFTGYEWLTDHAVLVKNEVIHALVPQTELDENIQIEFHEGLLVPSFIDAQIYGAYGSLLAAEPTAGTLRKTYDYCRAGGASYFLPTVATNSFEVIEACIAAVKMYWEEGGKGVIGLHVEGPWINKEKRGAHIESFIHSPSVDEVRSLLQIGKGVIKMITLAPEVCSTKVIGLIREAGIVISAGHSNATYAEATHAFNSGIHIATHLFNAMSSFHHREPGMAGAILDHDKVCCSMVPDGYHVAYAAIRVAKKIMKQRLFIITDAVAETTTGPYPHQLVGDKYEANGVLSGSALNMMTQVKNCIHHVGIEPDEALRMASLYPAQVLQLHSLGRIAPGYTATFTRLTHDLLLAG